MKRTTIPHALLAAFLIAAASPMPAAAQANNYPERPIQLLVPYPPGGPNDVIARFLGDKLTAAWNQRVVIENRPGAGGNIALEATARAKPDGYTIVLPAMAYAVNPSLMDKVPYTFDQFAAVSLVTKGPLVLVVHPSLGVSSLNELIARARQKPGALNYASGGSGSSLHLAGELLKAQARLDIQHVPYKGTNDLLPDLLAGRVPIAFLSPFTARKQVEDGALRALAVSSKERSASWPDLPAISEAVPGYEMDAWYAVLAPAGTPPEIVEKLSRQIAKDVQGPDLKPRWTGLGLEPIGSTPTEAQKYFDAEAAKWRRVLRGAP